MREVKSQAVAKYRAIEHKLLPESSWEHFEVYNKIKQTLISIPLYFESKTNIQDLAIQDLFSLNTSLGFSIEQQVVNTLNRQRAQWDSGSYGLYHFVRQQQVFPDVLFQNCADETNVLGVELKSWYVMATEGEPSFRYQVTPNACAKADLLVIVPWCLSGVINGTPVAFEPLVLSAKGAAYFRNHHWTDLRKTDSDSKIESPKNVTPYPKKGDLISDKAVYDSGSNFGRLARTGLLDDYNEMIMSRDMNGISVRGWHNFFKSQART